MFGYACIAIALFLALKSTNEYKAIAYLVLFEFVAHKVAYIFGVQLTGLLEFERIYLAYVLIQTFALYLMTIIQAHKAISTLILLNITYNVLTISQYVTNQYDFYSYYSTFVGAMMLLELVYLAGLTKYVENYNRKHGNTDFNHIDRVFSVSRRIRLGDVL